MEEYSESNKLVLYGLERTDEITEDEIKLYMPKKREKNRQLLSFCFRICRFLTMVAAFFLLYYCLYQLYVKSAVKPEDISASVSPESTSTAETEQTEKLKLPLVINESMVDINIEDFLKADSNFSLPRGDGVKVIIVNSHSSEYASSSLSVSDLGEDLAKILTSRGIATYFDATAYDADGTIGAYSGMSDGVAELVKKYNEAVAVIDIHNSSIGDVVTLTVGTSDSFAWQENLRFACNIYNEMKNDKNVIRLLPTELGQNNGLLTLNVGIGEKNCDDGTTRSLLLFVADALTAVLANEPLA